MTDFLPYSGSVMNGVASRETVELRESWDQLLLQGAQSAWDAARDGVTAGLRNVLGRADLIAPGISLYDIDLRLAEKISLGRAAGGSSVSGRVPMELQLAPDLL